MRLPNRNKTRLGKKQGEVIQPGKYQTDDEDAVKYFQDRHVLDADGAVGAQTIATMNVPVEQRIDQLRINLERQRWYDHENHGEFIVADIAGYNVL